MKRFGCDMRGFLSFQILCLLAKGPMHGEELAEELGRRRGEKPKAGTIYPALKDLNNKKLIRGEKRGKTIVYSLTPEGTKTVRFAKEYFMRCFGDVLEG